MKITVINAENNQIAAIEGEKELNLVLDYTYAQGDCIKISDCKEKYLWIMLDESLGESLVYAKGPIVYYVPVGEGKLSMSPRAFESGFHNIRVREAYDYEINAYQNLALNVNDQHENLTPFPHVSANVETRGESVFAARNAIDGMTANCAHGIWPFSSWGINRNPEAWLLLDFGRTVRINEVIIYLRADFPHDSWWKEITLEFSDGSELTADMKKTNQGQHIPFHEKEVEWVKLKNLRKAEDESPFPALTQIKVMGRNK